MGKPPFGGTTIIRPGAPEVAPFLRRHALGVTAAAPLVAAVVGSLFNIWYNLAHVQPLLSDGQQAHLRDVITVYNAVVYPLGVGLWLWTVFSVGGAFRDAWQGRTPDPAALARARVRAINLPWHISAIMTVAWTLCIPVFWGALAWEGEVLDPEFLPHLSISIILGALITVTYGFFATEYAACKLLFPVLFTDVHPAGIPGTITMTLRRRGLMWAISIGACPIVALLLVAHDVEPVTRNFLFAVGALGIAFGLMGSLLISRLVAEPVDVLKRAAQTVAGGDLDVEIDLLRADEFGPLIDEFNRMVAEMRNKERLRRTFGLHVGEAAAEQILASDPGLGGRECVVTVMFCDIRDFTARCSRCSADEAVSMLNEFLTVMVGIVERRHGGMVNKFLGDGFMAVFGAARVEGHEGVAVTAAGDMLASIGALNERLSGRGLEPLAIGIGIHTGPAIVGNVGSDERLEYTVIGDTVNLASRVEGLTKAVGRPLLFTEGTRRGLSADLSVERLEARRVKGREEPLDLFTVADSGAPVR